MAGDGDPVQSPVAPLCGLGCGPVASRLRAAVCLVPPWEASPDPDRKSAAACRAHRGGLRREQCGTPTSGTGTMQPFARLTLHFRDRHHDEDPAHSTI